MRAFQLVEELGAGEVVKTYIDENYEDETPKTVDFDPEWINKFLGTEIPESDMVEYLTRLGFEIKGRQGSFAMVQSGHCLQG